jgi:hypothetical protein
MQTKKILAAVQAGLRNGRPWSNEAEYRAHINTHSTERYMFLTWELTLNDIADGLRYAHRYRFDRNQFMRECGAHKFACQACFNENVVSEPSTHCGCDTTVKARRTA